MNKVVTWVFGMVTGVFAGVVLVALSMVTVPDAYCGMLNEIKKY